MGVQVIGSGGQSVTAVGVPTKTVQASVVRAVGAAAPPSASDGVPVASVVLYCPTLVEGNLTPSDGDTMFWVEFTPNLTNPDPDTGLTDWTTREQFTWTEGWATVNDPTKVLILTGDDSWRPSVLADVTPTGFEAIPVFGGQPIMVGCGGGSGDFAGALWGGWNIGAGQGGATDPSEPADIIVPTGLTADSVRIIDRSGAGEHFTLADWLLTASATLARSDRVVIEADDETDLDLVGVTRPETLVLLVSPDSDPLTATLPEGATVPLGTEVTFIFDGLQDAGDWTVACRGDDAIVASDGTVMEVLGPSFPLDPARGAAWTFRAAGGGVWALAGVPPVDVPDVPDVPATSAYFRSGSTYGPPRIVSGGTRAIASATASATPFPIEEDVTIDALSVDLSSAAASGLAVALHLVGIDAAGHPTSPVFTVSVTTTGTGTQFLTGTAAATLIPAGLYFAVVHNRSAQAVTPRAAAVGCHLPPLPHATASSANQFSCWLATVGTGALASFPAVGSSTAANQGPIVTIRVA